MATVAAVGGAVLVLLIKRVVTGEWLLLDFSEDLIRNVLVAGLVAAGTVVISENRRRQEEALARETQDRRNRLRVLRWHQIANLAATAWNQLPNDPVPDSTNPAAITKLAGEFSHRANDLRRRAERVEKIHDAPLPDEVKRDLLAFLPRTLFSYAEEGMRTRRFAFLEHLADELSGLDDADENDWSQPVAEFRRAVTAAVGWRSHTDATIVEKLLFEQVLGADLRPQTDEGRRLRACASLDSAATTFEPLYLLVVFLAATDDLTSSGSNEPWHAINRCLGALRNEMRMVAAAYDAFIPVLRATAAQSN